MIHCWKLSANSVCVYIDTNIQNIIKENICSLDKTLHVVPCDLLVYFDVIAVFLYVFNYCVFPLTTKVFNSNLNFMLVKYSQLHMQIILCIMCVIHLIFSVYILHNTYFSL